MAGALGIILAVQTKDKPGREIARQLQQHFGVVRRIGGGHQSRVYLLPKQNEVIKVYRESLGLNRLEAANMTRAGFGPWVIGAENLGKLELLRLRHFNAKPIRRADIAKALPGLKKFFHQLHAHKLGNTTNKETVNLAGVRSKLERFQRALREPMLQPLFAQVRAALHSGELEVQPCLCHLDLHRANILIGQNNNKVLVVDWTRSDWDDPARDFAIFFTGTLNVLPVKEALQLAWKLARQDKTNNTSKNNASKNSASKNNAAKNLATYIALQTLHDLYWFKTRQPLGYEKAFKAKVSRALRALRYSP